MTKKRIVMDADRIDRSITRIAYQILEKNKGVDDLALIGIRTRGVYLAQRIQEKILNIEGTNVPLGIVDITLYRDDLGQRKGKPRLERTEVPFSLDHKKVVLVDDVPFYRTHDPGGYGCVDRFWTAKAHSTGGPHRSRSSRAPHPGRFCR